jgi:N-acetylneuraminate synthase
MSDSTYIIAEAGVNHNGSMELAKELINVAAYAEANAVKFQTFKAANLATKNAPKADYQKQTTDTSESQYEMLKKYELTIQDHKDLIAYCAEKNIDFLSSAFDLDSLDLLVNEFGLNVIKFGSGEITNGPLLLKAAQSGVDIILSTGMSTLSDIETALAILSYGFLYQTTPNSLQDCFDAYSRGEARDILIDRVSLLHCTSEYPAPYDEINLRVMDALRTAFGLPVGYSDHTEGIVVPIAAVAKGATIIEKHITTDKTLPGPDHKASITPGELKDMVAGIRIAEMSLGINQKLVTAGEQNNARIVKKSLVADKEIKQGESFTKDNVSLKRSCGGVSGKYYWDILGKIANRDYAKNEAIVF